MDLLFLQVVHEQFLQVQDPPHLQLPAKKINSNQFNVHQQQIAKNSIKIFKNIKILLLFEQSQLGSIAVL